MRVGMFTASTLLLALAATGCSGSDGTSDTTTPPPATDEEATVPAGDTTETIAVDPQQLALGPGDLPDTFEPGPLDPQSGTDEAPPDCPALDSLEIDNEVGTQYMTSDEFQSVEIRVAGADQADAVIGHIAEVAACPDTEYTDSVGVDFTLKFDSIDLPAGGGASATGTAGGFPFAVQLAAFDAGGHLVTLSVTGLGGLPDDVDIADLVQLTVDRGNGTAEPAADAPTLAAPGEPADGGTGSADGGAGSRTEPLAVGDSAIVGDWDVTVDEIALDATDTLMSANDFNSEPENGNYALITITATYQGEGDGDAGFGLTAALSGADKRQYPDSGCTATEPEPMFDQPTVENGGTVTGQFCLDYPDEALGDGAVLFVEASLSINDTRTFWALP